MSPHTHPTHHAEVHEGHADKSEEGDEAKYGQNKDDAFPY